MCRVKIPFLVPALALPVCPTTGDNISISCFNTTIPSERVPVTDVAHVAHYFCHEVHGQTLLPGEELTHTVKSLAMRPIELKYVNIAPVEPWDVIYDACLEDAGRVWTTCVDDKETTAGGAAVWDDGALTIEIKMPLLGDR